MVQLSPVGVILHVSMHCSSPSYVMLFVQYSSVTFLYWINRTNCLALPYLASPLQQACTCVESVPLASRNMKQRAMQRIVEFCKKKTGRIPALCLSPSRQRQCAPLRQSHCSCHAPVHVLPSLPAAPRPLALQGLLPCGEDALVAVAQHGPAQQAQQGDGAA